MKEKIVMDDGFVVTFSDEGFEFPPDFVSYAHIYARRLDGTHIPWLGDDVVDLLMCDTECIGVRTNHGRPVTRMVKLTNAVLLGAGREISLGGWPGLDADGAELA